MKETYFDTKEKKDCSGCSLCVSCCPQKCINMEDDGCGFLYPVVDNKLCIHCDKCKRMCSNSNVNKHSIGNAYAVVNANSDELEKSSSGGMFLILARWTIENGGVVAGVELKQDMSASFAIATTYEECLRFCGSKYVRSDINNIYEKVNEYLKQGRLVLFTGTSCQVNSMINFAGKNVDKLITCDILCHANPSSKVYNYYIKDIERRYKKKVSDIQFRTKKNGWRDQTTRIVFSDGSETYDLAFFWAFVRELISRESCNSCVYASEERVADFTIADLWGADKLNLKYIDAGADKGISLVTVNTELAQSIFESVLELMKYESVNYHDAFSFNHKGNVAAHPRRAEFFEEVKAGTVNERNISDKMWAYCGENWRTRTVRKIKRKVKSVLKKTIKMIVGGSL